MFENAMAMVCRAKEGGYAVPALNTNGATYEITRAALEACVEKHSPCILQVYEPNTAYRGIPYFVKQATALVAELDVQVPVCLQLDHGKTVGVCTQGIDAGLTSVMIDGSHDPFDENVSVTRAVLDYARARGASVEAEIGYVA